MTEVASRNSAAELLRLTSAAWIAQAVSVAAELKVADAMADSAKSAEELAATTATHPAALRRLLRALAGEGLFTQDDEGRFALAPLGAALRSDAPGSVRALCAVRGEPWFWAAWGELLHSVKTGETGFSRAHGTKIFPHFGQHPDAAARFNTAMGDLSRTETAAVVAAYPFDHYPTVVDVGGGQGALLASILRANPGVRGVLVDLPATVARAHALLTETGVAERCTVTGGDFFGDVPAAGDLYVLKSVIHDWDDEQSIAILRNCRQAMVDAARLLLIERVIPPGNEPSFAKLQDLNMLVNTGGHERTEAEYGELFQRAGFGLARVIPTGVDVSLIEGVPTAI